MQPVGNLGRLLPFVRLDAILAPSRGTLTGGPKRLSASVRRRLCHALPRRAEHGAITRDG